jgi:hypothetical protein
MYRVERVVVHAVLALFLVTPVAWAQATATISGTVRDQTGAVLPGVTVTVTQAQTALTRTTVSNDTGSYVLPNLPLGPYRLEAVLSGFRTFAQTGITLQVNSAPVIDPVLSLGEVAEEVQVTAAAALVDTRSAGVSTVVESERIVELPLSGRQVTQLITLSGLAVQTGSSPGYTMNTGVSISVAGSNPSGVSYSLDGAPHINTFDGTGMHLPFPDALQEFRLVTGSQEAASGMRSGASVNGVTKAGTNVLHGNAFEFLRDSRFNAPDFLSGKSDELKRNQFGGTLGGPIVADRVFFFVGYQGTTTRQYPLNQAAFVPTAAMLAGDFTTFMSPACQGGRTVAPLRAPFVNNRIAAADISPAALATARQLPAPIDECGNVFWGSPVDQNEHQIPVRLDVQLGQQHSLFGRYMLTTDDRKIPFDLAGGNLLVTSEAGRDDRAHTFTVGHTWVISPTIVNSFRVLGNDVYSQRPGPKFLYLEDVGIKAYTYVPGYVRIVANSGFTLGAGFGSTNVYTKIRNYGASDDFTVVKGSHQFGFGGHYLWGHSDMVANAWSIGSYQFTGGVTGNGLADFFTGRITQHRAGAENPIQATQSFVGVYAQDVWSLNRVTLNYGVGWNPYIPLWFHDGQIYNFDRDKFLAGTRSTVMPNAPPGFSYPGDPGFKGKSGVNRYLNTWEPRVGVAWDVGGDGRTSVRVSAGIAHDYPTHTMHANTSNSSPFRLTVNLPPGVTLDDPWANYAGGNPFPYAYDPDNPQFPAYSSFLPLPPDLKPTTQYTWNAGVQRQIAPRWFAAATYVGTKLTNQIQAEEQNPALYIPGSCVAGQYGLTAPGPCSTAANLNFRRALNLADPSARIGYITQYVDVGYQDYHGMLLTSRFDVGRSLNFNVNYTLSKCEGVPAIAAVLNTGANHLHQPYQNNGPTDITLDEGLCIGDRRHVGNLTSVFRTPEFGNGLLKALASGWTASTVIQMRSGGPVNVVTGADIALNGFTDNTATQRPNVVPGVDPYGDRDGLTGYYNIAAFSQPTTGTLGDAPFNMLRGPGFWQWDQAFTRSFEFAPGRRVELRAEAINITNHFNRGNPAATLNNPATFGRIQSAAGTARVWQFALKYAF